jgi:dynamin 1-like protein
MGGDARSELSDEDIRTAIKNSGGVRGSLLIPDAPFELLVRRAIARLLTPCLQCKDFVHAELLRIAAQCTPPDITRFPRLHVCRAAPPPAPVNPVGYAHINSICMST